MPFFGGGSGDYHIIVTNIQGGTNAIPSSTGSNNMALGNGALELSITGDDNIAIGNNSLTALSSGARNISIGYLSLWQTTTQNDNVFIGMGKSFAYPTAPAPAIGEAIANVSTSVSLGNLSFSTGGNRHDIGHSISQSVGLGHDTITVSSVAAVSLSNIIAIGAGAGSFTANTSNVICIGQGATGATNSIAVGNLSNAPTNSIVIGNSSHTSVTIGGLALSSSSGSVFPNLIAGDPGTEGTGINIGGVTYNSVFKASDIGSTNIAQSILHRHSTTWEAIQVNARSNSDTSAHGAVTNGMLISSQYSAGWTGTEYNLFGRASFQAAATGTISDTSSPGDYVIATTPDGATLPVEAMRIKSDKSAVFAGGVVYPTSTFATLPATSSATNQIYQVTDIGPDGSLWKSNGTEWKPLNGRALLVMGNYPVGMPNNGTVGANGALTLNGTGLVNTYSGGIWLNFPAGALYAGSAAGFYWAVMTSATVGTVYDGVHNGAAEFLPALAGTLTPIVSAAVGAYLGVGVNTQASMFTIPAGAFGNFGTLEGLYSATFTSSASSKSITAFMGAGFATINAVTATAANSFNGLIKTCNRGTGRQVNNFNGLIQTANTGGITFTAVDTTVATPVVFALNNTGSNNDSLILETVELYLCK